MCDYGMNSQRELENHIERKHRDNDQLGGSTMPLVRSADSINGRYPVLKLVEKNLGATCFLNYARKWNIKTQTTLCSVSLCLMDGILMWQEVSRGCGSWINNFIIKNCARKIFIS